MKAGKLLPWGNYPHHPQRAHAAHWRDAVPAQLAQLAGEFGSLLPFGNGRSYGDSCLAASDEVLALRSLDKLIEVDWQHGIMRVEAGATLDEILRIALPRGWFLPVAPGTKFATVGGAVANDVHGKNHHRRGTFGQHVNRFGLLRSERGLLECSPRENMDLFAATIGGLGMTGVVLWAELRLLPVRSSRIASTSMRFGNLDEFFALSGEHDSRHEYTVAWIDCLARGGNLGRGIFTCGDHADDGVLEAHADGRLAIPVTPPFSLVNPLSLRAFNTLYYRRQPRATLRRTVDYDDFFFPLDGIAHWNRMYGPAGFQQYQCVVPERDARAVIAALLETIAAHGAGSFLAVLKRCGAQISPGLLSFPLPGISLALDFPQRQEANRKLFERMDRLVSEAGGRLYPAKDAHMSGTDFRRAYPAWRRVEELRDPVLLSRFWQRVTTGEPRVTGE
jgi:FAD/FMN-containing dehydrogenase